MMVILPLIYLSAFLFALRGIITGNRQEVLIYLIFGLPIYITALSITFELGFRDVIGIFQGFKEIIILTLLVFQISTLKASFRFQLIDYLVLAFFGYTLLYVLLPIGDYGFIIRLTAFKSSSFWVMVYFAGRFLDPATVYINKYFHYILYFAIAAAILGLTEFVTQTHFHTLIGFADFNYYIYNLEPNGLFGLSWTFETSTGLKRFGSLFANPIEHSAATILSLSVVAALYTTDDNKLKLNRFGSIALAATLISIITALSRASFASYFVVIYFYALVTGKKQIIRFVHFCFIAAVLYFIFMLQNDDLRDFVIGTLKFTDSSSVGHVLQWLEGIEAIIANPLGLGLGASGRMAGSMQGNVGGENQFIIFGVQAGLIAMFLYLSIYILMVKTTWKWFFKLEGKEKKICLALLLMKIGFVIPLMTSELETSSYISYMTWFFSGLFISVIAKRRPIPSSEPKSTFIKQ